MPRAVDALELPGGAGLIVDDSSDDDGIRSADRVVQVHQANIVSYTISGLHVGLEGQE
jgi:hypothetical protein